MAEMESAEGKSKFRTKFKNIKINEPVKMEWMDLKEKAKEYQKKGNM